MGPVRLLPAIALCACGVQYDPKNATPSAMARPQRAAVAKFEWRTTENDPKALFDKLARRAPAAGVFSSRMNTVLELSRGTTRLRMTSSASDVFYECWAAEQSDCNELIAAVLDAAEPAE